MESSQGRAANEDINLYELWVVLYSRKLVIISASICLSFVAYYASFLVQPTFKADVLLSPARDEDGLGSSKASIGGQFGGLAALAGVYSGGSESTQEALATLKSRVLTEAFINETNLMPVLYASKWDAASGRWISSDMNQQPSLWDADQYFSKNIRAVVEDKKSGLTSLVITWRDPVQAANWANELVARTNTMLRTKAVERSNRNLAYLQQQLEKTTIIEVRQSINHLIENEIKTLTLAEGAEEYAFKVIDPAVVPRRKSAPNRRLYALSGLILGLAAGVIYALLAKSVQGRAQHSKV